MGLCFLVDFVYYSGHKIENVKMDGTRSMYRGEKKCIYGLHRENMNKTGHVEGLGIGGSIILK
jgi:hypothetical protein